MGRHFFTLKLPLPLGGSGPHLTRVSPSKGHLEQFSRFRTAHERDQQTDTQAHTQTDRPRHSVCSCRQLLLDIAGLQCQS